VEKAQYPINVLYVEDCDISVKHVQATITKKDGKTAKQMSGMSGHDSNTQQ